MADLKLKFKMPDEETLAKYISIKGEKGDPGDPTKTSQLENDSDFTTNAALNSGLATKADASTVQGLSSQVSTNTAAIEALQSLKINISSGKDTSLFYYPLLTFQDITDDRIASSTNIHGRIGGNGTKSGGHLDVSVVASRGAIKAFGDYYTNNVLADRRVDFVMYKDESGDTPVYTLYIKAFKTFTIDVNISFRDCTNIFNENVRSSSEPVGTLLWSFLNDSNVQVHCNGTISANIDGDAATVNGHTVEADVPYGAVFTDTVYNDAAIQSELDTKANASEVATTYATKTELSTNVSSLDARISSLASGAPIAVSSMSNMTDTSRVYVLTTDGYWYYHNGSAWVSGGVYQAAVTDTNATLAQINDTLYETIELSEAIWQNGGVDPSDGYVTTGDTDRIVNKTVIHAKKGSYLTLTDTTNYKWKIAKYKNIPKNKLQYIGNVGGAYSFDEATTRVIDEDCFIVIVIARRNGTAITDGGNNYADVVSLLSGKIYLVDDTEPLDTELFVASDATTGAYWKKSDASFVTTTSSTGFNVASRQYRVKAGQVIKLIDKSNLTGSYLLCFMDENQTHISSLNVDYAFGAFVPDGAKYVVFSMRQADLSGYSFKISELKESNKENYRLIFDEPKIKLVAHRGLEDFAPEATIPAYTLAGEAGMWGLKIDICETLDGYFVCSHDATVDRMFDGTGNIRDLTLATIQNMTVDAGANIGQYPNLKIVQLYEALEICKRYNMHPYIEFKRLLSVDSVARVIEIIKQYGLLENTVCQCSDGIKDYLYALREITDIIPISYWKSSNNFYNEWDLMKARFFGNAWVSLGSENNPSATKFEEYAPTIRSLHLPLCAATLELSRIDLAKKWIKDYGLDLLITSGITYADLDY